MQKWEYQVLVRGFDRKDNFFWADDDKRNGQERLNAMGQEGWEFVQVVPISRTEPYMAGLTTALHYIFKRPVA